jgi:hypothetical protein
VKKAATIFIICIYGLSFLGFSVKEFYCCGRLKSVTLSLRETSREKNNIGENKKSCCKTKVLYLKVKNSHLASIIAIDASDNFHYAAIFAERHCTPMVVSISAVNANRSHAPPLHPGIAIYISNCVYRI